MSRLPHLLGALLLLALLAAPLAAAHATIELHGEQPIAGKRGTLTIPHGCGGGLSTDRLVVRLGPAWLSAKPVAIDVAGCETIRQLAEPFRGQGIELVITWVATGSGLPNSSSGDFPLSVRWPGKHGIYRTPTFQHCGASVMKWSDPYADAASADQDYPPIYPVPRIQILPAR